MNWPPEET
jgi:hypothetical protein